MFKPIYSSRSAYYRATKRSLEKAGKIPVRAQWDKGGNCIFCGEAGRCPGWHDLDEIRNSSVL